jgi:hypothetical protein
MDNATQQIREQFPDLKSAKMASNQPKLISKYISNFTKLGQTSDRRDSTQHEQLNSSFEIPNGRQLELRVVLNLIKNFKKMTKNSCYQTVFARKSEH